jgi:hypothetical protein
VKNAIYAPGQPDRRLKWPVGSDSVDLLTALSVWTHLNEGDAMFYLEEAARVLKPNRKAIITFFYLDRQYYDSLEMRTEGTGRYHRTSQKRWIFNERAYGSEHWFGRQGIPEDAIAVDAKGIKKLLKHSGLKLDSVHNGNWKEIPGIFFQDILIFQKA